MYWKILIAVFAFAAVFLLAYRHWRLFNGVPDHERFSKLGKKGKLELLIAIVKKRGGSGSGGIYDIRSPEKVPGLIRLLERGLGLDIAGDIEVRKAAAYALGEIGDRSAVPILIRALQEEKYNEVYYYNGRKGGEKVNRKVNIMAAKALGKIGDNTALPMLEASKTIYELREVTAEAIDKIKI